MAGINSTAQVSVANTATQIIGGNANRSGVVVYNNSSVIVFIGGVAVTTATGHFLPAGGSLSLAVNSPVFGIVATGTASVSVLEVA